jgi:hypothetical protein
MVAHTKLDGSGVAGVAQSVPEAEVSVQFVIGSPVSASVTLVTPPQVKVWPSSRTASAEPPCPLTSRLYTAARVFSDTVKATISGALFSKNKVIGIAVGGSFWKLSGLTVTFESMLWTDSPHRVPP